jgi:hypothetical protein
MIGIHNDERFEFRIGQYISGRRFSRLEITQNDIVTMNKMIKDPIDRERLVDWLDTVYVRYIPLLQE